MVVDPATDSVGKIGFAILESEIGFMQMCRSDQHVCKWPELPGRERHSGTEQIALHPRRRIHFQEWVRQRAIMPTHIGNEPDIGQNLAFDRPFPAIQITSVVQPVNPTCSTGLRSMLRSTDAIYWRFALRRLFSSSIYFLVNNLTVLPASQSILAPKPFTTE